MESSAKMAATTLKQRYEIVREVGRGGFGRTFLALDGCVSPGRRCAIKQLQPVLAKPQQFADVRDRFQREAAVLAQLSSGCAQIPHFYDRFTEAGNFYLVQEWIEGITLAEKVEREGPLGPDAVARLLAELLPVLIYLEQNRTIHRDIKPHNIIARHRDGKPVLIDFGAVKEVMALGPGSPSDSSTLVVGTPGYMAPEQAAGRPVYASDLYGLAMTALFLLSGRSPQDFATDSRTGEILWRKELPHLRGPLADALAGALMFHPRDRFAMAAEMLAVLQGHPGGMAAGGIAPTAWGGAAVTVSAPTRAALVPAAPTNYWRSYLLAAIATVATAATIGFAVVRWTRAPLAQGDTPESLATVPEPRVPDLEIPTSSPFPDPTLREPEESVESVEPESIPDLFIDTEPPTVVGDNFGGDALPESDPPAIAASEPPASGNEGAVRPNVIAFAPGTSSQEIRSRLGKPNRIRPSRLANLQELHYSDAVPGLVDLVFTENKNTQELKHTIAYLDASARPEVAEELLAQMLGGQLDPSLRQPLQAVLSGQDNTRSFQTPTANGTIFRRNRRLVLSVRSK